MLSSSIPRPPPISNSPGFGVYAVEVPVQNVFTTIASCVGPLVVNVIDEGSGWQVILTDDVAHPNLTVPVNGGIAVITMPIAIFPPGGTVGGTPFNGGVTVIVIGEFETVSSVEPCTSLCVADTVVVAVFGVGPVDVRLADPALPAWRRF